MLPDRVSNQGPLTYESGAQPIALRGPALCVCVCVCVAYDTFSYKHLDNITDLKYLSNSF